MKVTLKITMEGLMRALRAREHRLTEDIEARRAGMMVAGRRGGRDGRQVARPAARPNERNGDGRGT